MAERLRTLVTGAVQGVGFRPFVYRLATELGLHGWVLNSTHGVIIEVEGTRGTLECFLVRLQAERPPLSSIHGLEPAWLDLAGYAGFTIRDSAATDRPTTVVLPDVATCDDCRREIFTPEERRFRYPFTNCTNCGPRFTIVESLPYDRPHTSMARFSMCGACRQEYDDPRDRRFHAQPIACPACGPQLAFWAADGALAAVRDHALLQAAAAIASGRIVAVKGLGGFHLMTSATDDAAVARLRLRKHREEKPLAVMYPDLEAAARDCELAPLERRVLSSGEAPIVLVRRAARTALAASIAPGSPYVGAMLAYTPLHHLLLAAVGGPVVATSGNVSDEPICIDEHEAVARLSGIADHFLVHDRPIVRHVDDSVVAVVLGRELVLRRARGYAPFPVRLPVPVAPTLAVGAHLKNTVALAIDQNVFLSQHIGDLDTAESSEAFRRVVESFGRLYPEPPTRVVADLHPDYQSTRFARTLGPPVWQVQHHIAHVAACMAENELPGPVLGVAWDGSGFGPDGTVWGGEFLRVGPGSALRVATFRSFPLPGGDQAIREPRRVAVGMLHELLGDALWDRTDLAPLAAMSPVELGIVRRMLERRLNAPRTSSVGRLFDAIASLLGLRQRAAFEGQAAMLVELAAADDEAGTYPLDLGGRAEPAVPPDAAGMLEIDWRPLITAVLDDLASGTSVRTIARRVHRALADAVVDIARRQRLPAVALSGGCFQNRLLTRIVVDALAAAGFRAYWHQRVPPNDGGIALGQIAALALGVATPSA